MDHGKHLNRGAARFEKQAVLLHSVEYRRHGFHGCVRSGRNTRIRIAVSFRRKNQLEFVLTIDAGHINDGRAVKRGIQSSEARDSCGRCRDGYAAWRKPVGHRISGLAIGSESLGRFVPSPRPRLQLRSGMSSKQRVDVALVLHFAPYFKLESFGQQRLQHRGERIGGRIWR